MEPIQPIDNQNLNVIVGNNSPNIPNLNNSRISGPSVISTIERPALRDVETPVVRGLEVPIIDAPNTSINYPVINVPTQAEFDAAVKAEKEKKQQQEEKPKERALPSNPVPPPAVPQITQIPPIQTPVAEIPADKPNTPTLTVFGTDINLPDPSVVATAGAVAVVTTAATVASTAVFNVIKNAAEPMIREAAKNKFRSEEHRLNSSH